MNTETIIRLLTNSGLNVLGADNAYIYIEDPSCVLRSFATFVEYAWFFITILTALLITGWAFSKIRGAATDIFTNMRNLVLIFGTLSAAVPIINTIYGDDLFARGCKTMKVSLTQVNKLLDARKAELSKHNADDIYEDLQIYDSAFDETLPYSVQPITSSGATQHLSDGVVSDTANGETVGATPSGTSAQASDKDVIYTTSDGKKYKRTGGTRAWKNNNPGNIRYSEFARRAGAIGQAGGFAVFPDEQTGQNAIKALLRTDSYKNLTLANAISRYAPPSENNTAGYRRHLEQITGVPINKRVNELSDDEMDRVANAIRKIEGWKVGRVVTMQ